MTYRIPARRRSTKPGRFSETVTIPAPVGGWNARDSLAAMKRTDAVVLSNWFPMTTDVTVRGGAVDHKTGFPAPVQTLMAYNALNPLGSRLFAAAGTGIFDITTAGGAVGSAVVTISDAKWQWTNFGIATNHFLIACNGVDKPLYFDGINWIAVDAGSTPSLLGVASTDLIAPFVFKRRLHFIEKNKMSFWFLPVDVAGGSLSEFRLNNVAPRGGHLVALGSWTRDGGSGTDDVFVAVTSEGEVIAFAGTDPSTANAWAHIGTYYYGKPLGRRCFEKFGGDLLLLTERGVFPLSATLGLPEEERGRLALTNKIENAFASAARIGGSLFGWQPIAHHAQAALLFNVPVSNTSFEQYVMNSITKAWCRFTGWNSFTTATYNGELYLGMADKVARAWTGHADFDANIEHKAIQAFSDLGSPGQTKQVSGLRHYISADGGFTYQYGVVVDFESDAFLNEGGYSLIGSSLWDTAIWDTAIWGGSADIKKDWRGVSAWPGFFIAPALSLVNKGVDIKWIGTDLLFEEGDGL